MENFISDGYTETGFIAAVDGLHGELRFTFRPMLPEEVDEVQAVLDQEHVARSHEIIRGVLVRHIKSWSDGLPVTADSLRTIRPSLWNRLYLIVSGRQASDPDPKATPQERSSWVNDVLEAGKTGEVGAVRAERDAKNSEPG